MIQKNQKNNIVQKGTILVQALVFGSIAVVIIGGLVSWAGVNIKASRLAVYREQALQIAESGIDYYRWHLAHAPSDYQDGTGTTTPYIHQFYDKDGNQIGSFTLEITPPASGSTIVTIKSTGAVVDDVSVSRAIVARLAIPSLAKFAVVSNDNMRFGEGTEVFGPIHVNGGIRFDGLAHNVISSSRDTYDDPDHAGANEFGVHTHVTAPPGSGVNNAFRPLEAPANPVASRPDVFESGRQLPVPAVDFTGLTTDLASIKADAQASGRYFAASGNQGYRVFFRTNDTFDLYRVTALQAVGGGCTNTQNQTGWGSWSIRTSGGPVGQTLIGNYAIPANGLIFLEDNVWVDGQINTARVTLAAGRFPDNPATRPSITVNANLLYTNYDGTDVIALISQGNFNVGQYSANVLRIDAALVAQNGRAGRYYYPTACSDDTKATLTLYGMIATNVRYGFAYTDGTGYGTRNIIYDANLLYGPPPSFPLTSDQYQIISWEEVR